jgi:chitodextrinase
LIGRGQTAASLADAITGNDYISFTVAPTAGNTISISSVKIRPISQNGPRTFVLLSNVSGFTAGNEISTFTANGEEGALTTINVTGHSNLSSAVEFRVYVFGNTNEWEAVGIGNRRASLAEADLIVEGSVGTSSTVAVTGVSLSPTSASVSVGSTQQLTATVAPANATNKNVSWSSSNPSVATVNATGLVTAVSSGSATITVTTQDGSFTATAAVTVPVVVVPDTQAPTAPAALVASAITTTSFTLTWAAATDNVGVTAYKVYRNDVLVATTTNTTAALTGLAPQTAYAVKVSAEDAAGNTAASPVITVTTPAPAPVTVTREVWSNPTGKGIAGIPVNTTPTSTTQLTTLEGPTDAADNYGARIRAYLTPTVSGNYTFYLAGDDVAELWLSFNDNPGQKTKIAEVTKAVKPREWTKTPAQKSTARNLTAGVKYYIEVLHRETTGKDHVAVGWTGPGVPAVALVPGSVLSPFGINTPPPVTGEGRPAYNTGKGFFVKNAKLYDANGNGFIPIGYNGTVFWQSEECQKNSLDDIARTGANTVRLVQVIPAERNNWSWGSRTENHRALVASSVANKLVPMLEFHDATCGSLYENDPEGPAKSLKPIVDYWVSPAMVQLCKDYEKELMVNIANEWGSRENLVEWKNAYKTSIARMRQAGIKNLIVIDAGGNCGQYPDGVITYAQEIIDSDPEKNVLFSIHMYAFWYSGTTNAAGWRFQVEAKLQEFKTKNIPIMIGEFGWEGTPDVSYDPRVVMAKAAELEMGWLFWSWFDQPQNVYYNVVKDGCIGYNSDADLTVAGNNIVNGANGVRAKSKIATIYTPATAARQAAAGREAGLSRPESTDVLLLYPNPVTGGRLTVQFVAREKGKATVTLMGGLGQSALKQESAVEAGQNKIDVSTRALPAGLYMLTLQQGSHRIVRKVLIN